MLHNDVQLGTSLGIRLIRWLKKMCSRDKIGNPFKVFLRQQNYLIRYTQLKQELNKTFLPFARYSSSLGAEVHVSVDDNGHRHDIIDVWPVCWVQL